MKLEEKDKITITELVLQQIRESELRVIKTSGQSKLIIIPDGLKDYIRTQGF